MKVTSALSILGALALAESRRIDASNRNLGKKRGYAIPYIHGQPPPPPPPNAGNGHWVLVHHHDIGSIWDDDGHVDDDDDGPVWEDDGHEPVEDDGMIWEDDGHTDFGDDENWEGDGFKTPSPSAPHTVSPTAKPTVAATIWSDDGHDDEDEGWNDDGHEAAHPLEKVEEEEAEEEVVEKGNLKSVCFENGSSVECDGEPIGKEIYYEYTYKIEISPAERRRRLEESESSSFESVVHKLENAMLNEFSHLIDENSLSMQALTRMTGPPQDIESDEECTAATEGNECYVMVGKMNAYMSPDSEVDEKEFICDVYSFMKYIVDYGDFSSVERLDALEFLGSENQYCTESIMADSFRTTNEAGDSSAFPAGAAALIAVACVATLLVAYQFARHKKSDVDEEFEIGSLEDDEKESVTSFDDDIQGNIVVPETTEATEGDIEVEDTFLRQDVELENLSTVKESGGNNYSEDDLESF